MFLTIFYAAATWMQSRRLGTLRKKISEYANNQSSLVFYKVSSGGNEAEAGIFTVAASSSYCKDNEKAIIGEVLHFSGNTRSCTLQPQQVVNVDNWITITDEAAFPIKLSKRKTTLLKHPRLFVLVEAQVLEFPTNQNSQSFNLSQMGTLRAWRADGHLGLIVESDIDHLTKFSSLFLSYPIFLDLGLEVNRIQTVRVEGKPCLMIQERQNVIKSPSIDSQVYSFADDSIGSEWSSRQSNIQTSPTFWKNQMELLRSFSERASRTSRGSVVLVSDDHPASIVPGNRVLQLESPTVFDIPDPPISEKAIRERRSVQSESCPRNGRTGEFMYKSSSSAGLPYDIPKCSRDSSTVVSAQSTPSRYESQGRKSTFSSLFSMASTSTLSVRSVGSEKMKPPNVLIYAESPTTTENIKAVLNETLHRHKYTIYKITEAQLFSGVWAGNCFLLVICGNVHPQLEPILTTYLIQGGKLLCLCSSFLHTLLPTFRTAEVREKELVHFSYSRWRRVRLMHHVFCYQNSPSRTKFSGDSDEASSDRDRVSPVPQTPSSVEVIDNNGVSHTLHVQVLGVEETWQTPSLLLAYFASPGGCAVFSQVHLELDPSQGAEDEEDEELRKSALTRKEIIKDILSTHLGMEVGGGSGPATYTVAYFLGRHEDKLKFLEKINHLVRDGVYKLDQISLKFCKKGDTAPSASANLLPVLIHSCPRDFSTVEYFDNLETRSLGRLMIYSEVLRSSMDVVSGELAHGFAVVPSQQTSGKGRTSNQWLSPPGCAMFSLQIHFPSDSYMGRHPSILQHMVTTAIASGLAQLGPDYEKAFDLHLKWPNDLYTSASVKIGGLIITCSANKSNIVCNIGCGINLDNEVPTTCLNKLVDDYNKSNNTKLKKLSREKYFAVVFTQLEKILDAIDAGNVQYAESLYYKYWLHGGAQVRVLDSFGSLRQVTILGIDEFGFLKVREVSGNTFTVHPDGNSFDMMEGLIAPKL